MNCVRRALPRLLVAVGLTWSTCALADSTDDPALKEVESCQARLNPRVDIGIERVQRLCPKLLPALESAPWRELLPSTLGERREEISAQSLRALADLVRNATDTGAARLAPDREALAPVLAELGEKGKQGATRWERFKQWVKEKFSERDRNSEVGWLQRMARKLRTSEGVAEVLTYLGYAMVGALVLFVVWSELRAAGLLGGKRRERGPGANAEWRRRLMLTDVMAAPLAERPGMMLRLLGEALSRAHRLPPADALTAAALVRRARLDIEAQRAALAEVASTAEGVRYAPQAPSDETIEGAVKTARELLDRFARLRRVRR